MCGGLNPFQYRHPAGKFRRQASNETFIGNLDSSTAGQSLNEIGNLQADDRIGRYVLRERIGHGAFSVVWRANDTHLKRDVAIKILRPDKIEHDGSIIVRLIREGRAVAAIDHPGVVKIHEVCNNNDLTFIVEQFVDGPTLRKKIEEEVPPRRRSVEIVRDVSRAVHAAHTCGVVHRDIKPANILLSGGETPILVDFGLAYLDQFADATLTKQGELLGTPAYMSPEQAQGQQQLVDARTDVYSLGAVLYHLLTGELPFGGSMLSMLDDVVHKVPGRAKLAQHSIDHDLETIVLKCLEKEPADRYQSAEELADDLQRQLDGEPIKARPVGMMEKSWKWSKRHPRWAGAFIGIFLLVAFWLGTLIQLRSISAQRTRAEIAERRSQQLLRDSTKAAGRLAMQRGKMSEAVEHFRQAQELSSGSDPGLNLDLIESLIAIRQIDEAERELKKIQIDALPKDFRGHGRFLKAQLELETGDPYVADRLFELASQEPLSAGRAAYVRGMLAERSPDAVEELKKSLEIEPLSHHPRRMLVTLLLSLAEFGEATNQLKIAEQLFPQDVDFQLLKAIVLASNDQIEDAESQLNGLQLPLKQKHNWKRLCHELHDFRATYNHRKQEFGFNQASLSRLSKMYLDVVGPSLSERGFVFPPKIAIRFANLFHCLEEFSNGNVDLSATWPELSEVVEIHPEGSLIILDLSTLLNQDKISEAFERCKKLKSAKGFVRDSDEMLAEIQFTSALIQFTQGDPKSDRTEIFTSGTDAVGKFEDYPHLINRFSKNATYCRILTIFLIESFKANIAREQLVQKWLSRLKDNPESDKNQTIWFEAVVANRAGRPFDALSLLEELQENSQRTNTPLDDQLQKLAIAMHDAIKFVLKQNLEKSETIDLSASDEPIPNPDSDSDSDN